MLLRTLKKLLFPEDKKTHQYDNPFAYKLVEYTSADSSKTEIIWNGTNLTPPSYVVDISQKFKLYRHKVYDSDIPQYKPCSGERYFSYKSAEKYVKERKPVLEFYWERNFDGCQDHYSSYEEYFAVACRRIDKPRLELLTK